MPVEAISVQAYSPRYLFVSVMLPGLEFDVVSLHAPTTSVPKRLIHLYWDEVTRVRSAFTSNRPCFIGCDCNGRVGEDMPVAGDVASEAPDTNGLRFLKLLRKVRSSAANTFHFNDVFLCDQARSFAHWYRYSF